jgi:hypothetical protein
MITPEFRFLRAPPAKLASNQPLASSLQAFETSLELVSLARYPAALLACVNAWESALKAAFQIPESDRTTNLRTLLTKADEQIKPCAWWSTAKNKNLREKRNHITHYGYTPKDTNSCATLLLEVGYPGLACLYEQFFEFPVMLQQCCDSPTTFGSLSKSDLEKVGLVPQWGDLLWFALDQFQRHQASHTLAPTWYFHPLASAIRLGFRESWTSPAENETLVLAESDGILYEQQEKLRDRVTRQMSDCRTTLFCPICDAADTILIEFDEDALDDGPMTTKWCFCVACHFSLPSAAGSLVPALVTEDLFPHWQTLRIDCGLE